MNDDQRQTRTDGGSAADATGAPEIIDPDELDALETTPGIVRRVVFERPDLVVGQSTIAAGSTTGWHHHGERDVFGYIVRGEGLFEYGDGGRLTGRAPAYFHVPAGTLHRETNTGDEDLVVAAGFVGAGPVVVNVDDADAA